MPHIDSVIYLDSDVLVLAPLLDLWNIISDEMGNKKMAAAAPNSEPPGWGYYPNDTETPFYGVRGNVY